MARLNNESQMDSPAHVSDHILSPQPCAPHSKDQLLTSFETTHLPSENGSRIDDGQMFARDYEYSSSASSTRHSTSDVFGREMDDELAQMKSRASSRSSLSSTPASVLVHPLDQMKSISSRNIHETATGYTLEDDEANFGGFEGPPKSIRTIRQREAAFRKPSSVRAMQMHTEDEGDDDEYLTPPRRRAGLRSPGSSPLKRSPYYSPNAHANKPKVKKEFPLVLLHCNLLAPSLPVAKAAEPQNQKILEEVLPALYWKRWRRLQDKVGSGVLRDRGVLISHPEDLYDVLEERLLESLELQRSRLHQGHFLGHEDSGPGSEGELSDKGESETDGEQGDECPDCGGRVLRHSDSNRKWEIKVFAANGLMRAGAWAAAWKEMEKVDVEVGLWLPSDIRRALERRMAEEDAVNGVSQSSPGINQTGIFGIDPRRLSVQTHARTVSDTGSFQAGAQSSKSSTDFELNEQQNDRNTNKQPEIALQTLVINYVRVLASDRRNVALVLMSVLVVFLAIGSRPQYVPSQSPIHPFPRDTAEPPTVQFTSMATPSISIAFSSSASEENLSTSSSAVSFVTDAIIPTPTQERLTPSSALENHLGEPEMIPQPTSVETSLEELHDANGDDVEQHVAEVHDGAVELEEQS